MRDLAAKYVRSFGIGFRNALEYRLNFVTTLLSAVSPVVIQIALWRNIYGTRQDHNLFGFTYTQMIAYTVVANLIGRLVRTGFEYEVNADIRTGGLDRYLVKPMGYFGYRLFVFFGTKAAQTALITLALAVAVLVLGGVLGFPLDVASVLGFAASIPVAFALNFLIFWCVGLLGFWLTEIGFLFEAIRIVIVTASGGIFPLSVFGRRGEAVLGALPFRFTIQFPTEILCGRLDGPRVLQGFGVSLLWILLLTASSWVLWRRGIRRFVAVGS
jgi:ABC-2 type transport system permease protein